MSGPAPRDLATDAVGYWEPRRIAYNGVLALVVLATWLAQAPRPVPTGQMLQGLFMLAVLANVAFCAAYPFDLLMQWSGHRARWLRLRWLLFAVGASFAAVLAHNITRGVLGAQG